MLASKATVAFSILLQTFCYWPAKVFIVCGQVIYHYILVQCLEIHHNNGISIDQINIEQNINSVQRNRECLSHVWYFCLNDFIGTLFVGLKDFFFYLPWKHHPAAPTAPKNPMKLIAALGKMVKYFLSW